MSQSSKVSKVFGSVQSVGSEVDLLVGTGALGAVSLSKEVTVVSTTGAATATLADGSVGQQKVIVMTVDGGDCVLTPANLVGASTTITFNDVGDACHLVWAGSAWHVVSSSATVA